MKAAFIVNNRVEYRTDSPTPTPGSEQALLRIRLAGVCGTDIALLKGYADFEGIPGHEFVADVVEAGENVDKQWLNKRVVAEINQWCGNCNACKQQRYTHCEHRSVIGIRHQPGVFAEYAVANANTLHLVPDEISDEHAVFIEPLAAAFRIFEQLEGIDYKNILIIGAGRLGQLIARVAALQNKQTFVSCRHQKQRASLNDLSLTCIDENSIQENSFDLVIETSGHASGFEQSLNAVRPEGYCVLKSTYAKTELDLSPIVIKEITLLGSRCGSFATAINALANHSIDPRPLIEQIYPLEEVATAFEHARKPGCMKILLTP